MQNENHPSATCVDTHSFQLHDFARFHEYDFENFHCQLVANSPQNSNTKVIFRENSIFDEKVWFYKRESENFREIRKSLQICFILVISLKNAVLDQQGQVFLKKNRKHFNIVVGGWHKCCIF